MSSMRGRGGRSCKASNVGRQEAAGLRAQGVCEGERPGAGPRGPSGAGPLGGVRLTADCSVARAAGLWLRRGAVRSPELRARSLPTALGRRAHGARGAVHRPARVLQLDAPRREEDAFGRRAQAAKLSAFVTAAAALPSAGGGGTWRARGSAAGPDRGRRTSAGRATLARVRAFRSEHGRVAPDGRAACGSFLALRSGPGTGGPLSAGGAAAKRTCASGHASARSLVPSGAPRARLRLRPTGTSQLGTRSSRRAPDKMARPVRGAFGTPRRPPGLFWLLVLVLRLELATAAAPRSPCAAACTCAGDSLDCGGRGLAALPGDLPAWTRSL